MWISEPACLAAPSCIVEAQDPWESPWPQPLGEISLERASNRLRSHELFSSQFRHGAREPTSFRASHTSPRVESLYPARVRRSEEHTSELQSRQYLVCRLLLEKKNPNQ